MKKLIHFVGQESDLSKNMKTLTLNESFKKDCTTTNADCPQPQIDLDSPFEKPNLDYFSTLPYEVSLHIFQYLDLESLEKCSKVCRNWYQTTLDYTLYQELDLKKGCKNTKKSGILNFFIKVCWNVKKLKICLCTKDSSLVGVFTDFLQKCCSGLIDLEVFVHHSDFIPVIKHCKNLTKLHLETVPGIPYDFTDLSQLNKLLSLNLKCSSINDDGLQKIINSNPNLKHINIDSCYRLKKLDDIVTSTVNSHPQLVTWNSYAVESLTDVGIAQFSKCPNLEELNLGMCPVSAPGNCIQKIALGCPKLRVLNMKCWKNLNDQKMIPLALHLKSLTDLQISWCETVTKTFCEEALLKLPKLQCLRISYCNIPYHYVQKWKTLYPQIIIEWKA